MSQFFDADILNREPAMIAYTTDVVTSMTIGTVEVVEEAISNPLLLSWQCTLPSNGVSISTFWGYKN